MAKPRKQQGNPDFRHRVSPPAPASAEIERRLFELISPGTFSNLKVVKDKQRSLRSRVLTLPVMAAIVMSLVYRQVPHLSDVLRLLETEGLLWVERVSVSRQALSQRLNSLPAKLFAQLFEQVVERIGSRQAPQPLSGQWRDVAQRFEVVWSADASTLEALKKHFGQLQSQVGSVLGGKMLVAVEVFSHRPVVAWYEPNAKAHESQWSTALLERLPIGGLLVVDLGFYCFKWFDDFTDAGKFILTRQKPKVRYQTIQVLSQGERYCDQLIQMGVHHTHPCRHPLRLVSVRWGTTWYHYLSNVLDPQQLSAQQLADLYRTRWRIETAFNLTKRLLGLSYFWVGGSNGVQLQLYATWIFYAVLTDLSHDVALALSQPLERISVEMVFRSLYFFNSARSRHPDLQLIPWLVEHQRSMGLVKAVRRRQQSTKAQSLDIWADALT
ncbi:MAG: IS4 family transposase [Leptolyngbyaceae cyanobacterium SM1_4_3]|nr:IS4 family transposase [Leptolyngbyaceae cyanobacterium SM1_4_3]